MGEMCAGRQWVPRAVAMGAALVTPAPFPVPHISMGLSGSNPAADTFPTLFSITTTGTLALAVTHSLGVPRRWRSDRAAEG